MLQEEVSKMFDFEPELERLLVAEDFSSQVTCFSHKDTNSYCKLHLNDTH
jgi:hypothetical protein